MAASEWEYRIISLWTAEPGSGTENLVREAELDSLGVEGWELVSVVALNSDPQHGQTPLELFFKREAVAADRFVE